MEARINLLQKKQEATNQRIVYHQRQASEKEMQYSDMKSNFANLKRQLSLQKAMQQEQQELLRQKAIEAKSAQQQTKERLRQEIEQKTKAVRD